MNSIQWTEAKCIRYLFPLVISISFAMDVFVPAIPVMSSFFKTNDTVMQASLYVFMLTVALGQLIVGPLADQYGRRRIAIYAALLYFIGSILSALSQSISLLIMARVIQAAGSCGTYLICFIIVRDNFPTTVCARLFSILGGINAMIASLAPVIGGLLIDTTHDWHSSFYFLTLIGLLMSITAFYRIPNYAYPKQNTAQLKIFKTILTNHYFRQYTLIASVNLLGLYLFCALSPGILISQLHLSATHYGLWFGLNALTVFFINIITAGLTYYYSLEKIVRFGLACILFACILMIFLNYYNTSVLRFMLPMLCLTSGIGFSMGTATALALQDLKQQAGSATALIGACQFSLAGFIGILTAQWEPKPWVLAFPVLCISILAFMKTRKMGIKVLLNP
ncbi:multidrug effflux MFS transporter [Legionella gresilensis]|uniref:multidrug effflux MFS transporter n=1 Tax=Legionella gresilensis TaxID=91823 RepID=UPI00104124A4|nr:multidrug effflux MFS transporter [Legionella gresilensis]